MKRYLHVLTHFEVREEALILKNVAFTWLAMHLPIHPSTRKVNDMHNSYVHTSYMQKGYCTNVRYNIYVDFSPSRSHYTLGTNTVY